MGYVSFHLAFHKHQNGRMGVKVNVQSGETQTKRISQSGGSAYDCERAQHEPRESEGVRYNDSVRWPNHGVARPL